MADWGHVEKKPGEGNFLLRFLYCGNISKFESCNGDAIKVFVPKTVTYSFHSDQSYMYEIYASSSMLISIIWLTLPSFDSMLIQYKAYVSVADRFPTLNFKPTLGRRLC